VEQAERKGVRRQLITLPTGAGKTVVFCAIARARNARTLVLAHREELLDQAAGKFKMIWPEASVGKVKAEVNELGRQVTVASVQTACRPNRLEELRSQDFDLLIIDEAHHAPADSYRAVIEGLGFLEDDSRRLLLGVTATARRGDGAALGAIFQKITFERSIGAMIRAGYLADLRGLRVQTQTDLQGVTIRQGDFAAGELAAVVNCEDRNRLIVEAHQKHARGLLTVAFCVDVQHTKDLAEEFQKAGVKAAPVWGDMPREDRKQVLADLAERRLDVVTNCNLLTEGFDLEQLGCLLMARPTKSQGLYIQMVGRGARPYPGKAECLIIDFTDSRHDVCQLGTLAGKEYLKPGRSILETMREDDEQRQRQELKARAAGVRVEAFDLVGRSEFRWFEIPGRGCWRLPIGPQKYIFLGRESVDTFSVFLQEGDTLTQRLSATPLSLAYAMGTAEDYARRNARAFSSRGARWREEPVSEGQLRVLQEMGLRPYEGITKGEASDLIETENIRRRFEPATDRQIYFLRSCGVEIRRGLTKRDASKMIQEIKEGKAA
jgi:superfamily II DNA or RNA helicase